MGKAQAKMEAEERRPRDSSLEPCHFKVSSHVFPFLLFPSNFSANSPSCLFFTCRTLKLGHTS